MTKLFHASEESNISVFVPRLPTRKDLDPTVPLVWAIDEGHLPNYLTPRDCPRVCYSINSATTAQDIDRYIGTSFRHVVVIEKEWLQRLQSTTLYLYSFDPRDFVLQDACAGYYVATKTLMPTQIFMNKAMKNLGGERHIRNCTMRWKKYSVRILQTNKRPE